MRRGFKAEAERLAEQCRERCGVEADRPLLPARTLALALGVRLIEPREITGIPDMVLETLRADSSSWSAITVPAPSGPVVIVNPFHAPARQESDLMHELAHIICGHEPGGIVLIGTSHLPLRVYDQVQEEEAAWLGGCLQLPRFALLRSIAGGMSSAEIAAHFGASEALVTWRRNHTAADVQVRRARARG